MLVLVTGVVLLVAGCCDAVETGESVGVGSGGGPMFGSSGGGGDGGGDDESFLGSMDTAKVSFFACVLKGE